MASVGIRELKQDTSAILRRVRERGEMVDVTHHGRVVARIVPVAMAPTRSRRRLRDPWREIDALAERSRRGGRRASPRSTQFEARDVGDVVVDASVWVSRAYNRDVAHALTATWFDRQAKDGALHVAPVLVLAEVAGALAQVTRSSDVGQRVAERLARLPGLRLVALDRVLGPRAAEIAATLRLRGADAVYVAVAERLGLPLATWDDEQRTRAGALIPTILPG